MSGAETQVDLQIESKLLSVSMGIVPVHSGRAENQYSEPSQKKFASTVHILAVHL